jgi:uncharacterized protein YdaU (DUF1376 family)
MNYYPFHVGDYIAHTAHLDPIEDLAYRRLLDAYYIAEGPIEGTPEQIARLIRLRGHVEVVAAILVEFFDGSEPGFWRHARCDLEIAKFHAMRDGGRKGAANRWRQAGDTPADRGAIGGALGEGSPPHGPPNANQNQNQKEQGLPLPVQEQPFRSEQLLGAENRNEPATNAPRKRSADTNGTRLPDGWKPDAALYAWAATERPDCDVNLELDAFVDHWRAQPGAKGRKADWNATWRNWIRRANARPAAKLAQARGRYGGAPTLPERVKAAADEQRATEARQVGPMRPIFDVIAKAVPQTVMQALDAPTGGNREPV